VLAQVALDGVQDFGVVVYGQEDRLGHIPDITLPSTKGSVISTETARRAGIAVGLGRFQAGQS